MACAAVHTGSGFLAATLGNLDCQGRTIGAYGYGALADPGSPVAHALTAILTIFVALFGIRLLLGHGMATRDLVGAAIRVGLFLTLASSWPAWRVVAYDLVLDGPGQVAGAIGRASALPGSAGDLAARLQEVDDGVVALTATGSGRLTIGISTAFRPGESAAGVALSDQTAFGAGRAVFLAAVIGAQGLLRIGAGLLLALAPLLSGLLLFAGTRALFVGWVRALGFCALGQLAFAVIAGSWLALLDPWLSDVLAQRQIDQLTASAPTELLVLSLAFAATISAVMLLIGRMIFLPDLAGRFTAVLAQGASAFQAPPSSGPVREGPMQQRPGRAHLLAAALEGALRREEAAPPPRIPTITLRERGEPGGEARRSSGASQTGEARLGETWRRSSRRTSAAGQRRDRT